MGTYLQELKVVHTVVHWGLHQLGEDILDKLFKALCNQLETETNVE